MFCSAVLEWKVKNYPHVDLAASPTANVLPESKTNMCFSLCFFKPFSKAGSASLQSLLFTGKGLAGFSRQEMFKQPSGVGVHMTQRVFCLEPCHGLLPGLGMLQNLPSAVVAHVLQPAPGACVLDMCASPGGDSLCIFITRLPACLSWSCFPALKTVCALGPILCGLGESLSRLKVVIPGTVCTVCDMYTYVCIHVHA